MSNMKMTRVYDIKRRIDHCHHYIERVNERYSVEITEIEYNKLCDEFVGRYKMGNYKTIGFVFFKGVKIWSLYLNEAKCLSTAYPNIIETDAIELIRACFPKSIRAMAYYIHEKYLEEAKYVAKLMFSSRKEAAKYYFSHTLFPSLHMDNYVYNSVNLFKMVHKIHEIIYNDSSYAQLTLTKKQISDGNRR